MGIVRNFALLLSFLPLAAAAQDSPEAGQPSRHVPLIRLEDASSREVPFATQDALTTPILCAADGTSFVQLVRVNPQSASPGMSDILSISTNGNQVVQFNSGKINDINEPYIRNFAVGDSDLYVLVRGSIPENKILKFKKPNGEIFEQQAARPVDYIAHFKKDGSYRGAIRLDIPFDPLQVGVFPDGDFLIAGDDKSTVEPRIALVKANGQLQRFVELPGDLHRQGEQQADTNSKDKNADPAALPQFGKAYNDNLYGALHLSMIIPDGRNMLLVRPGYRVPVFSISPGGEVMAINLEMPAGHALADLKVGKNNWIGIYTQRRTDGNGLEIETAVHDSATGKMIAQYAYPRALGLAAACVGQGQISFLTTQENGKLILNTLSIPASGPSTETPPGKRPTK